MTACRPSIWLIGLLPVAFLSAFVLTGVRERGETELAQRLDAALNAAGHQWSIVTVKGRDAKIAGVAFDEAERDSALAVAEGVWGIRAVSDRVDLQTASTPYSWRVTYKSNRIRIKGFVPSSDDRATILGFLKANIPDAEIDDRMKLAAGGPARELWLGGVSFGLTQLGRMKSGSVRLDGAQLVITGEARTPLDYETLRKSLRSEIPVGLQLVQNDVIPPRIKPFIWAAQYDGKALTLTGYVQNDSERKAVITSAQKSFRDLEITDRMEFAIGAPGAWPDAIGVALSQLARAQSGRVAFSEIEVTFTAVVKDRMIADSVQVELKKLLPHDYKTQTTFQLPGESQASGRSGATQLNPVLLYFAGTTRPPAGK